MPFSYTNAAAASATKAVTLAGAYAKAGFPTQDPAVNRSEAIRLIAAAVQKGVWAWGYKSNGLFARVDQVGVATPFSSTPPDVQKELEDEFNNALLAAVAYQGPITSKRYWIILSTRVWPSVNDPSKKLHVFFSLPDLSVVGMHGKLSIMMAEDIAAYLENGGKSMITGYLESKGYTLGQTRRYAFTKAVYVSTFDKKADYDNYQKDMQAIFSGMANNAKGKGARPSLTFFQ